MIRSAGRDDEPRVAPPDERDVPVGAAALAKGLYLLDVIGERAKPPRFRDLQAATGLPKGTLARLLNTLVLYRLVRHEESDNTYRLGHRVFELAHRVWDSFDLRGAAAPVLDRLAETMRETVALCALDGTHILYIDQRARGGAFGFRIEVGRRAPLHCTAGGKALLAFAAPQTQRALLGTTPLERFTDRTLVDREALMSDLALTRARGYALSIGEHVAGVSAAAAPIFDHTGRAIAAIGMFGPSERLAPDQLHVAGRDLMEQARTISGNAGAAAMNIDSYRRPAPHSDPRLRCVLPWSASLAEGPLWSPREGRLYWVDILAPSIHRFDPLSGRNEERPLTRLVSAVAERRSGGLVALTQHGLETLDFGSGQLAPLVRPEADNPEHRFNDGKCDAAGRLWAGTMRLDASAADGSLYRIDGSLHAQRMDGGFTVSNGLDWSPDGRCLYFADSAAGHIYVYEFKPRTGTLGERRVLVALAPEDGRPDGLAVDSAGTIWVAIWDGWSVRRYAPDGRLLEIVRLPVPRPTSLCFGGADLRTLFVTSARVRLPAHVLAEAPLSGSLFALPVDTPGLPAHGFAG
jgi:sugar lactone lactonase YvrE/DNA-binding IclR family transcriptional regulator